MNWREVEEHRLRFYLRDHMEAARKREADRRSDEFADYVVGRNPFIRMRIHWDDGIETYTLDELLEGVTEQNLHREFPEEDEKGRFFRYNVSGGHPDIWPRVYLIDDTTARPGPYSDYFATLRREREERLGRIEAVPSVLARPSGPHADGRREAVSREA